MAWGLGREWERERVCFFSERKGGGHSLENGGRHHWENSRQLCGSNNMLGKGSWVWDKRWNPSGLADGIAISPFHLMDFSIGASSSLLQSVQVWAGLGCPSEILHLAASGADDKLAHELWCPVKQLRVVARGLERPSLWSRAWGCWHQLGGQLEHWSWWQEILPELRGLPMRHQAYFAWTLLQRQLASFSLTFLVRIWHAM